MKPRYCSVTAKGTRCRRAFRGGRLPANIGDLALAKESVHVTDEEIDYIDSLVGDELEFEIR